MTLIAERTRYRCSAAAEDTWRKLLAVFRLEDPQRYGRDWSDFGLLRSGDYRDICTEPRTLRWDAEQALDLLATFGPEKRRAVKLAERRLSGHGMGELERAWGMAHEEALGLLDMAKQWVHEYVTG